MSWKVNSASISSRAKNSAPLYIGYSSNQARRVYEHREGAIPGFTKKYNVKRLVYFEAFDAPRLA